MGQIWVGMTILSVPGVGGESLEGAKMGVRPRRPGLA